MTIQRSIVSALIIAVFGVGTISAQAEWVKKLKSENWLKPLNEIELLRSSRSDVRKLFGNAPLEIEFADYFETPSGEFTFEYTTIDCADRNGNLVPKGTLEFIEFEPSVEIRFSKLKLPLREFKKGREADVPQIKIYQHQKEGVEIQVFDGRVIWIDFGPPGNWAVRRNFCNENSPDR